MSIRIWSIASLVACAICLGGCGSPSPSPTGPAPGVNGPAQATPGTSGSTKQARSGDHTGSPSSPSPLYTHSWLMKSVQTDGSTYQTVIRTGAVIPGTKAEGIFSGSELNGCSFNAGSQFDPGRDAVIQYEMTATNTTSGFNVTASPGFYFLYGLQHLTYANFPDNESVLVVEPVSNGTWQCGTDQGMSMGNVGWSWNLRSGQSGSYMQGIVVLYNWRSPAHPAGDAALTSGVWLWEPSPSAGGNVTKLTGPTVLNLSNDPNMYGGFAGATGWYWPADGTISRPFCEVLQGPQYADPYAAGKCRAAS